VCAEVAVQGHAEDACVRRARRYDDCVREGLTVDRDFVVPYYTFIFRGFLDAGLTESIRFERINAPGRPATMDGTPMLLTRGGQSIRMFVSTGDSHQVDDGMFEWADVYGKVNLDFDEHRPGFVPLGPTFGITLWPLPVGYLRLVQLARTGRVPIDRIRQLRFQSITRLPIDRYEHRPADAGYVFHASRPWRDRHEQTNHPRQRFFAACAAAGVEVDGGFLDDRLDLGTYIERVQRSAFVFNSPAVHRCLGWKLGEYLALGKAILSTPLSRSLPAPLEHGVHAHFVDDDVDSIRAGVELLLNDNSYRSRLECGAMQWYQAHLAPARVAERLVQAANNL
jgi:hypothetical protein